MFPEGISIIKASETTLQNQAPDVIHLLISVKIEIIPFSYEFNHGMRFFGQGWILLKLSCAISCSFSLFKYYGSLEWGIYEPWLRR